MDKRVYLKVKIKSLQEEAKIIRKEERRNEDFKKGLREHRKKIVRPESRHTHLAYAFLRGRPYKTVEPKAHTEPDWIRARKMVERYGVVWEENQTMAEYEKKQKELLARFDRWKDE